jgi:hypothetical protein
LKSNINLGRYREAVLWEAEYPSIHNAVDKQLEMTVQLSCPKVSENQKFALELKLPRNSSYYALLGAEYTPNNTSELKITIYLRDESGILFQSDLGLSEEVYQGIPTEYGNAILSSVRECIIASNWNYAGCLTVNFGAHSLIGSSELMFSKVAKILIILLSAALSKEAILPDKIISAELDK